MGLDMYLKVAPKVESVEELEQLEKRLSKAYYAGNLEKELKAIQKEKGFKNPIKYEISEWVGDEEEYVNENKEYHSPKICLANEAGYWRKFNALHDWFVQKCQDGVDECQTSLVDPDLLQDLFDKLLKINKKNAAKILPTTEGFFFGGTEYNEYYWDNVERLKMFLIQLFEKHDFKEQTLFYRSSW